MKNALYSMVYIICVLSAIIGYLICHQVTITYLGFENYQNVKWEGHASDNSRQYHSRNLISDIQERKIENIPGIEWAFAHQPTYEVEVFLAKLYTWEEVHDKILKILEE